MLIEAWKVAQLADLPSGGIQQEAVLLNSSILRK